MIFNTGIKTVLLYEAKTKNYRHQNSLSTYKYLSAQDTPDQLARDRQE